MVKSNKKRIMVSLPLSVVECLDNICEQTNTTRSTLVYGCIVDFLKRLNEVRKTEKVEN